MVGAEKCDERKSCAERCRERQWMKEILAKDFLCNLIRSPLTFYPK